MATSSTSATIITFVSVNRPSLLWWVFVVCALVVDAAAASPWAAGATVVLVAGAAGVAPASVPVASRDEGGALGQPCSVR